jgi:hypothetical protein
MPIANGSTLSSTAFRAERGVTLVIAGGARGADTLAEEWAKAVGLPCRVFMADWAGLGRKAGPIRNEQMLSKGQPHLVVAFPGGRGTAHMMGIARACIIQVMSASSCDASSSSVLSETRTLSQISWRPRREIPPARDHQALPNA